MNHSNPVLRELIRIGQEKKEEVENISRARATNFNERPADGTWSLAQNVNHLIKSEWLVLLGMQLMSFTAPVFRWLHRQPVPDDPRQVYSDIYGRYLSNLKKSLEAGNINTAPVYTRPNDDSFELEKLLAKWDQNDRTLNDILNRLSDEDAAAMVLPHPSLGGLSLLEMIGFQAAHRDYHLQKMAQKSF